MFCNDLDDFIEDTEFDRNDEYSSTISNMNKLNLDIVSLIPCIKSNQNIQSNMSVPSKKLISKAVTQTPSKTSIDRSLTVNSTRRNISSKIDIDT